LLEVVGTTDDGRLEGVLKMFSRLNGLSAVSGTSTAAVVPRGVMLWDDVEETVPYIGSINERIESCKPNTA
jgi:hypothetical protein